MPFEYLINVTSVINVLKAHNTTTASPDLSLSLASGRISDDNIQNTDPEIVMTRNDGFPAIFVRISNKDEAFQGVGRTGNTSDRVRKEGKVTYDVIGFVQKESARLSHESLLNDAYILARNIEGVFQKEFDLSGTALWCNPGSTDFYGPFEVKGSWLKTVLVRLEAKYLFR